MCLEARRCIDGLMADVTMYIYDRPDQLAFLSECRVREWYRVACLHA